MFGKILESTKGYLTTDTSELDQVKKRLEEKDDHIKIKNSKINELTKENQRLLKSVKSLQDEIQRMIEKEKVSIDDKISCSCGVIEKGVMSIERTEGLSLLRREEENSFQIIRVFNEKIDEYIRKVNESNASYNKSYSFNLESKKKEEIFTLIKKHFQNEDDYISRISSWISQFHESVHEKVKEILGKPIINHDFQRENEDFQMKNYEKLKEKMKIQKKIVKKKLEDSKSYENEKIISDENEKTSQNKKRRRKKKKDLPSQIEENEENLKENTVFEEEKSGKEEKNQIEAEEYEEIEEEEEIMSKYQMDGFGFNINKTYLVSKGNENENEKVDKEIEDLLQRIKSKEVEVEVKVDEEEIIKLFTNQVEEVNNNILLKNNQNQQEILSQIQIIKDFITKTESFLVKNQENKEKSEEIQRLQLEILRISSEKEEISIKNQVNSLEFKTLTEKMLCLEQHWKLKDDEFEKTIEQNTELLEMKEEAIGKALNLINLVKQVLTMIINIIPIEDKENEKDKDLDQLSIIFQSYSSSNDLTKFREEVIKLSNNLLIKLLKSEMDSFSKGIIEDIKSIKTRQLLQLQANNPSQILSNNKEIRQFIIDLLLQISTKLEEQSKILLSFQEKDKENNETSLKNKKLQLQIEENSKEIEKNKERTSLLTSQVELYKIENTELMNKINEKSMIEKGLQAKLSSQIKLNEDLLKNSSLLNEIKEKYSEVLLKNTDLEKENSVIKANFIELEDMIHMSKQSHETEIDLLQSNISDLMIELRLKDEENLKVKSELEEISENFLVEKRKFEKEIENFSLENKNLKEIKEKMKGYCDEILEKTKLELLEKKFLIDKRIVSNHFLKYFDKNIDWRIKASLVEALANIFEFNNEERKKIGLNPIFSKEKEKEGGNENGGSGNDKLQQLSDLLYNSIMND